MIDQGYYWRKSLDLRKNNTFDIWNWVILLSFAFVLSVYSVLYVKFCMGQHLWVVMIKCWLCFGVQTSKWQCYGVFLCIFVLKSFYENFRSMFQILGSLLTTLYIYSCFIYWGACKVIYNITQVLSLFSDTFSTTFTKDWGEEWLKCTKRLLIAFYASSVELNFL